MSFCDLLLRPLFPVVSLAAVCCLCGCGGGGDSDRPETYPVTGTVTYNGAPVEGASVTFSPNVPISQVGQGGARGAFGVTDAEGKYQLTTFAPQDGALPGEYRVSIMKYEGVEPLPPDYNEEEDYEAPDPNAQDTPRKSLIPEKYASAGTSGFTVTVKEEQNEQDFPLAD
jgi:hypothetical protein